MIIWWIAMGCLPDIPEVLEGLAVEAGAPQACPSPRPAVSYVESATAMGLPAREEQPHIDGGFVVVDDFDADGLLDILLLDTERPEVLAWNKGTRFDAQQIDELAFAWQGNLADIDGDGWRDLLVSGVEPRVAYGGDGGRFVTEPLEPLPDVSAKEVREYVPADFDRDGDFDLYPLPRGPLDGPDIPGFWVYRNEDGVLVPDGTVLPASWVAGQGIDATWMNHGGDQDLDLYVVNDMGPRYGGNRLATQREGRFQDATEDCGCGLVLSGMGVSVGDGNGDGLADLYIANSFLTVLLEALPDGSYVNTTAARGVQPITHPWGMAWGAVWLDHDNDGLQDLLVAQGDLWTEFAEERAHEAPVQLFRNLGSTYEDRSAALGLATEGSHRATVARDFNADGVLDLLVTSVSGPHLLYLSEGCTAEGWLEVEAPIGAEVRVTAGGKTQVGWATTESGWGASALPVVHFGLGEAQTVERVEVRWSGKGVALDEVEARRRLVVRPL